MFLFFCFLLLFLVFSDDLGPHHIQNVGHRGDPTSAPENTMAAFHEALENGCDGFETDLRFTKDNFIVLLHDETLDRTTNCSGKIVDYTLAEALTCDAGSWYDPKYAGEKIPTLEQAVKFAQTNDLFIVMDLKTELLGKKISETVIPLSMQGRVVASCWTDSQVLDIRKYLNATVKQRLGSVPEKIDEEYFTDKLKKGIHAFSLQSTLTHPIPTEFLKMAHRHQMQVYAWSLDEHAEFDSVARNGIDGIITNKPPHLKAFLDELKKILFSDPPEKIKHIKDPMTHHSRPIIIAHRGDQTHAPENTLSAFKSAKDHLADGYETDLRFTSDGYVILIHDDTVDRTSNCTGKVIDFTLEEIRKCDAGSWFDPKFAGEKFPTLEEAVDLAKELGLFIVLDLKVNELGKYIAKTVIPRDMETQVLASCRNNGQIVDIKNYLPVTVVQSLNNAPKKYDESYFIDRMNRDIHSFSFNFNEDLNAKFVHDCHKHLMPVVSWISYTKEQMFQAYKDTHDSIMVNDPQTLYELIKEVRERAWPVN